MKMILKIASRNIMKKLILKLLKKLFLIMSSKIKILRKIINLVILRKIPKVKKLLIFCEFCLCI